MGVMAVIGVSTDVGAPVNDEHAFVQAAGKAFGQHAAGKARPDD
jgi:hypothetical protein